MDSILYTLNLARMGQRPRQAVKRFLDPEGVAFRSLIRPFQGRTVMHWLPVALPPAIKSSPFRAL